MSSLVMSLRSQPITKKCMDEFEIREKKVRVSTMQGYRRSNEDTSFVIQLTPKLYLCAVNDGHGGSEVSRVLGELFAATFKDLNTLKGKDIDDIIKQGFIEIDSMLGPCIEQKFNEDEKMSKKKMGGVFNMLMLEMFTEARNNSHTIDRNKIKSEIINKIMGATCTALFIDFEEKIFKVATIGDCQAILSNGGHTHIPIQERIHNLSVQEEYDRAISAGHTVSGTPLRICGIVSLAVSRAFGDACFKDPSVLLTRFV